MAIIAKVAEVVSPLAEEVVLATVAVVPIAVAVTELDVVDELAAVVAAHRIRGTIAPSHQPRAKDRFRR